MRTLLLGALLLASFLHAYARPHPGRAQFADWSHVQALPSGAPVHVQAQTRHALCILSAVTGETLTCVRDTGVGSKELVFQRTEITAITLARRGPSAVLGGALGAGAGAIAGGLEGARSNYFAVKGAFAMIYAFSGAFAGAPIGYLTDFSASTVYRAP